MLAQGNLCSDTSFPSIWPICQVCNSSLLESCLDNSHYAPFTTVFCRHPTAPVMSRMFYLTLLHSDRSPVSSLTSWSIVQQMVPIRYAWISIALSSRSLWLRFTPGDTFSRYYTSPKYRSSLLHPAAHGVTPAEPSSCRRPPANHSGLQVHMASCHIP